MRNMPGMTTIGERIKQARGKAGLSRVRLAAALGRDPSTIVRWESGATQPAIADVMRLADALACDGQWLVFGEAA